MTSMTATTNITALRPMATNAIIFATFRLVRADSYRFPPGSSSRAASARVMATYARPSPTSGAQENKHARMAYTNGRMGTPPASTAARRLRGRRGRSSSSSSSRETRGRLGASFSSSSEARRDELTGRCSSSSTSSSDSSKSAAFAGTRIGCLHALHRTRFPAEVSLNLSALWHWGQLTTFAIKMGGKRCRVYRPSHVMPMQSKGLSPR